MKAAILVLIVPLVVCLSLVVAAQLPQQQGPDPTQQLDPDRFEAAHGALLDTQDKAKEASRLTEAVAAALPNAGPSGPIPRKNYVDEHIVGRIERDNIPHAPLAGDEEFLRRAYLDASGNLPSPCYTLADATIETNGNDFRIKKFAWLRTEGACGSGDLFKWSWNRASF